MEREKKKRKMEERKVTKAKEGSLARVGRGVREREWAGEQYLLLLLTTELEVLAALEGKLHLVLALLALKTKHDLLGGLGLLLEHGLGLSTETLLLSVVTALSLGEDGGLAGLVLGDLVKGVLAALLGGAESLAGLGNVHLQTDCAIVSIHISKSKKIIF